MPTRFDALENAHEKDSESDDDECDTDEATAKGAVPSYEDLSSFRADEETVLVAVYGDDFWSEEGVWGCPRLNFNVRPPDTAPENVGSELTLSAQLGKKYPYVTPTLELQNVKGLTRQEQQEVLAIVNERARECAGIGSVMMCEIVQEAEDYLMEHNKDPAKAKMSAWEQMKEREAAEEEAKRIQKEQQEAPLELHDDSSYQQKRFELSSFDKSAGGGHLAPAAVIQAEKELARQMQTLDAAFADRERIRKLQSNFDDEQSRGLKSLNGSEGFIDLDGEDGVYNDDFEEQPLTPSSSRYQTDFVELGLLGRGGGGEVVKARNRLDRRIYAIKKIPLEAETGRYAEFAKVHNKKLLREVVHISRMTHSNIVRYYQAWVEGVEKEEGRKDAPIDGNHDNVEASDSIDSGSDDSGGGFWEKSPALGPLPDGDEDVSIGSSSEINLGDPLQHGMRTDGVYDESTNSLLEHEYNEDFKSPLLVGAGFQSRTYEAFAVSPNDKGSSSKPSAELGISDLFEDDSSQKVDESDTEVLYIQMEYCSNTLRHLIDDGACCEMDPIDVWRIARQTIEALSYIHGRNIIHRDLKPGNVFLDSESNVRLGDFGLATLHTATTRNADTRAREPDINESSEAQILHDAIEDISSLLGGSRSRQQSSRMSRTSSQESLTGGVGTTFYRAPEQERCQRKSRAARQGKGGDYDMKADIYSLGIVLFELFADPFPTYMERAETLSRLRGEDLSKHVTSKGQHVSPGGEKKHDDAEKDWNALATERFPEAFRIKAPESAQKIILWCLRERPGDRPSAKQLLSSDLLPKKLELEERYLEEALSILSNPQNESNAKILQYLFDRPTPEHADSVFDTDVALRAKGQSHFDLLQTALRSLGYTQRDLDSLRSSSMSSASCSQLAAILALRRGRAIAKRSIGGGELLRGAPQRTVSAIAAMAAASAAISGSADGILGADPRVVERICENLRKIFQHHGAVWIDGPTLRPRLSETTDGSGGPVELMSADGTVLLMPEDTTAGFARAIARGGTVAAALKRYTISRVFHKSLVGGHPTEKLEASFDVVYDDPYTKAEVFEAELLVVVSQVMASYNGSGMKPPFWFLRLTHTRLADAILDICGVPQKDSPRGAALRILTACTAPSPSSWYSESSASETVKAKEVGVNASRSDFKKYLDVARERHGLPNTAANRLGTIFSDALPLPSDDDKAVERLYQGIERLRQIDTQGKALSRARSKRYEDAHRALRSVRYFFSLMKSLKIHPTSPGQDAKRLSLAKFISIDLGLRQKRKNIHGQGLFQAVAIPDDYLTKLGSSNHENLAQFMASCGTRIAEGGRYDDLIRKHRPPGNFGRIPICAGCRFFVGSLTEQAYLHGLNDLAGTALKRSVRLQSQIEAARSSLGFPLAKTHPMNCIVVSANGMDPATLAERARVAAQLWREGISAEYTPMSGVISSLVRKNTPEAGALGSDLSLDELCGVALLLRIPCVVIVVPHLLREKGSVRLRYLFDDSVDEVFVPLQDLPGKVKEHLLASTDDGTSTHKETIEQSGVLGRQSSNVEETKGSSSAAVDCIYADEDMYYAVQEADRKKGAADKVAMKVVRKEIARATQKAETYIDCIATSAKGHGTPVIASALPYLLIRELGTRLITSSNTFEAVTTVTANYPQYRRLLKTVGMSIDRVLAEYGDRQHENIDVLMYSTLDDRFDIISIGDVVMPSPPQPGTTDRRNRSSSFDVKSGKRR